MSGGDPDPVDGKAEAAGAGGSTVRITVQILELLAQSREPLRMSEIARTLGMSKTKVFRHLATLRELEFVRSVRDGERLTLGPRLIMLGRRASEQIGLAEIATPYLTTLRNTINMSIGLAIPNGRDAVTVLSLPSLEAASINIREGEVLTWPRSPSTQVLIALEPETKWMNEVEALDLSKNKRSALVKSLRRTSADRYRVEFDVLGDGLAAIAVPVIGPNDEGVAAIFALTTSAVLTDPPESKLLAAMLTCANGIGHSLGLTAR